MGKGSKPTIGFWYHLAYHHGLTIGPIDAFLEFRGGDKTAWRGELTSSGTIHVNAPMLWGGEKDQGGIVGDLDVMFGEPTQVPNPYLVQTFGNQTAAWRGFSTVAFKGGRYGAMNPYPKPPSYKFRQILDHWDEPGCWYPEKAAITVALVKSGKPDWRYKVVPYANTDDYSATGFDDSAWAIGAAPFASFHDPASSYWNGPAAHDFGKMPGTDVPQSQAVWQRTHVHLQVVPDVVVYEAFIDNDCKIWINGVLAVDVGGAVGSYYSGTIPASLFHAGDNVIAARGADRDAGSGNWYYFDWRMTANNGLIAANPAHVLYYSRTNSDMGRESRDAINDASLRAAADRLYAEGFGICPDWDPASESVEEFEKRICKLIGGSFTRSLEDGQWYLDLARGDYVLDDLPVLTDDDILDFKEQPAILDNAVNSVSVRYFDPERKETIVTAPTRALGLVAAFGTIHQTTDYRAIPTDELASRIAQRDVMASATPKRVFDLATTRKTYAWRPNQYFRLQTPKRGIADMVCLVGDKQSGTLKSGAIRMKAAQDIYSLPSTGHVQVEPGVDTRPPQTPTPITAQRALEAPYVEVATMLTRADLAALPAEVGYAMAVAANPGGDLDYSMLIADVSGDYVDAGRGEWCATAIVVEAAGYLDTDFTLAAGAGLDAVTVGMGALWGEEIVRVDAIDVGAGTITLGRGCADTVPQPHVGGERLWIYPTGFAYSATEFTDAETVDVKLLANTGSQQQDLASATALPVTFDQRQARPYPPANLTINGVAYPAKVASGLALSWAHRDRITQADQLLDTTAASVGPETGTTYTVRTYLDGALQSTTTGISGTTHTPASPSSGVVRVEVESVRGGLASWQPLAATFDFGGPVITTTSLRFYNGEGGTLQLQQSYGTAPFVYTSDPLPSGITMDAAGLLTYDGTAGVLAPADYNFTITDTNGLSSTSAISLGVLETPLALFAGAEIGVWFDLNDLSTLFQDTAGTIPVTAAGQTVRLVHDKSGNNLHATGIAVLAGVSGRYFLQFNGTSHAFSFPGFGTGKLRHFGYGGRLRVAGPTQVVLEQSANFNSNAGAFLHYTAGGGATRFDQRQSVSPNFYNTAIWSADINPVMSIQWQFDRTKAALVDQRTVWKNNVSVGLSTDGSVSNVPITIDFPNLTHYLGSRGGTTLFAGLDLYQLVGCNRLLTTAERGWLDAFIAAKTGI